MAYDFKKLSDVEVISDIASADVLLVNGGIVNRCPGEMFVKQFQPENEATGSSNILMLDYRENRFWNDVTFADIDNVLSNGGIVYFNTLSQRQHEGMMITQDMLRYERFHIYFGISARVDGIPSIVFMTADRDAEIFMLQDGFEELISILPESSL